MAKVTIEEIAPGMKQFSGAAKLKVHVKEQFFFSGLDLVKTREALNLSQGEFARKCGWSQQNQQQLELPDIEHILDFAKREAFKKAGIDGFDSKP